MRIWFLAKVDSAEGVVRQEWLERRFCRGISCDCLFWFGCWPRFEWSEISRLWISLGQCRSGYGGFTLKIEFVISPAGVCYMVKVYCQVQARRKLRVYKAWARYRRRQVELWYTSPLIFCKQQSSHEFFDWFTFQSNLDAVSEESSCVDGLVRFDSLRYNAI